MELEYCDPPGACNTHKRCWTHSRWEYDNEVFNDDSLTKTLLYLWDLEELPGSQLMKEAEEMWAAGQDAKRHSMGIPSIWH